MNAEVLSIGDEIASGQLLDTNSRWLSQRLGELGVRVLYHTTVGDDLAASAAVFRQAIDRAEVVISTGGLGPTADDLTREALAQATGRPLARDEAALAHVRRIYALRGRPMPERNELQALFPEGSRMLPNADGTAPGIAMRIPRPGREPCHFFALPGVPAEMTEMWNSSVRGALIEAGAGRRVIRHRLVKCFGTGESNVEAMLPDLIRRGRVPQVGITASQTTIILRITAEGADDADCDRAMAPTIQTIRQCLGSLVFGQDDEELQDVVLRFLARRGKTLATAEWGTAGLVAHWLESAAGAAGRCLGGIVVSDEGSLERALDVPKALVQEHSATSAAVAEAMALGARRRFAADYGLAVSRFPEPDPAAAGPPLFFLALASPEGVRAKGVPFAGHPATLTVYSAKHALNFTRLALGE